jgi:hypothetical protein
MSENCETKPIKLGTCGLCQKDVYSGDACTIFDVLYHTECGSKAATAKEAKAAGTANADQKKASALTGPVALVKKFSAPDRLGKLPR